MQSHNVQEAEKTDTGYWPWENMTTGRSEDFTAEILRNLGKKLSMTEWKYAGYQELDGLLGMLEYAMFVKTFTQSRISMAVSADTSSSAVSYSIRKLQDYGYIEKVTYGESGNKKPCFRITQKGLTRIGSMSPYHGMYVEAILKKHDSETTARTQGIFRTGESDERGAGQMNLPLRTAKGLLSDAAANGASYDIEAMMFGTGISTFCPQKPCFAELAAGLTGRIPDSSCADSLYRKMNPEDPRKDALEYIMDGLYYTSAEVREGLAMLGIEDDTFLGSRFRGVLLTGTGKYAAYWFTWDGYMYFNADTESAFLAVIQRLFPYTSRRPVCMMFASSYAPAAAISVGFSHGHDSLKEKNDNKLAAEMARLLSMPLPENGLRQPLKGTIR